MDRAVAIHLGVGVGLTGSSLAVAVESVSVGTVTDYGVGIGPFPVTEYVLQYDLRLLLAASLLALVGGFALYRAGKLSIVPRHLGPNLWVQPPPSELPYWGLLVGGGVLILLGLAWAVGSVSLSDACRCAVGLRFDRLDWVLAAASSGAGSCCVVLADRRD